MRGDWLVVTWDSGAQEVEELSVLGVHDGSFYELHHRVTTILKLGMTPQTERSCMRTSIRCEYKHVHCLEIKPLLESCEITV